MNTATRIPTHHARHVVRWAGTWLLLTGVVSLSLIVMVSIPVLVVRPEVIGAAFLTFVIVATVLGVVGAFALARNWRDLLFTPTKYATATNHEGRVKRVYRLGPFWVGWLFSKYSTPYTGRERLAAILGAAILAMISAAMVATLLTGPHFGEDAFELNTMATYYAYLCGVFVPILLLTAHPKAHRVTRGFTGGWATNKTEGQ